MKKEKKVEIERSVDRKTLFDSFLKLLGTNYSIEQRLSDGEREVLVEFMALPDKFKYNRFSTLGRKVVRESLKKSNTHLNRYIYFLEKKKFIYKDNDGIFCLATVLDKILNVDKLELNFKFLVKDE